MKLSQAVLISATSAAVPFHGNVRRNLQGSWIDSLDRTLSADRTRRAEIDGELGFQTLATMMLYMNGFGADMTDPELHNQYTNKVAELKQRYTNYGCYCWIDGADAGVIGGGKTKDMTDHHCKELYRCYKCVNIDYAKNYTDVSYNVDFNLDRAGNRQLDCSVNSKQDASNICECDKRFAENIAATVDSCNAGQADDDRFGAYCMDEGLRTTTGGGDFEPRKQCEKAFPDHSKTQCCGQYPNRVPYDDDFAECCRLESRVEDIFRFRKLPVGQCSDMGGEVVISEDGNPNSYIAVASMATNNNNDDEEPVNNAASMFAGRK